MSIVDMTITTTKGIDDLLALANTRHGPGGHHHARAETGDPEHDHLDDAGEARAFLGGHDVDVPATPPPSADLRSLRRLRDAVHALADGAAEPSARLASRLGADARYRLADDGRIASDATGWRALVEDLLPALIELRRQADRLRACGNPLCRFLYVDRSRNRSRTWCDPAACGNRVRVRRHRAGTDEAGAPITRRAGSGATAAARRRRRRSAARRG